MTCCSWAVIDKAGSLKASCISCYHVDVEKTNGPWVAKSEVESEHVFPRLVVFLPHVPLLDSPAHFILRKLMHRRSCVHSLSIKATSLQTELLPSPALTEPSCGDWPT